MQRSMSNVAKTLVLLTALLVSACAGSSSYMRNVAPEQANYEPKPGKALIVFMRPSGIGFAVQSSVFDVTDGNPVFLGIVSAKTKIAHDANPGELRYMVTSESADFMGATLEQGKVYYALVTPRMGVWKARFSLHPVHDVNSAEFGAWYAGTRWVENLETANGWAKANQASIRQR